MDKLERLQKIIAQSGLASRRQAEEWIKQGLVQVNGKIAALGQKADPLVDSIKVKGKLLNPKKIALDLVYFVFFKPRNVICALGDPAGRSSILDFTKKLKIKLFPVGRLDFAAEGLVLLTNDGAFANNAQKNDKILRVYLAKVKGHFDAHTLKRLSRGGTFDDKKIYPKSVNIQEQLTQKSKIRFAFEGQFSGDLKSFIESRGVLVEKITRIQLGHLTLDGLMPGEMKEIKASSATAVLNQPELGQRVLDNNTTVPRRHSKKEVEEHQTEAEPNQETASRGPERTSNSRAGLARPVPATPDKTARPSPTTRGPARGPIRRQTRLNSDGSSQGDSNEGFAGKRPGFDARKNPQSRSEKPKKPVGRTQTRAAAPLPWRSDANPKKSRRARFNPHKPR